MSKYEEKKLLEIDPKPNSRSQAPLLSKKFYIYLDDFFRTGWKRDLEDNDITLPQTKANSDVLCKRLEKCWQKEIESDSPSLSRALRKAFLPELLKKHAAAIWFSEFLRFIQCFVLKWLMDAFKAGSSNYAYAYALLFGLCSIVWTLVHHPAFFVLSEAGGLVEDFQYAL